ncbi:MAG: hypothetical protein ACYS5V_00020 [Planctomycetota bacterium]|jgi:hypothetical protein
MSDRTPSAGAIRAARAIVTDPEMASHIQGKPRRQFVAEETGADMAELETDFVEYIARIIDDNMDSGLLVEPPHPVPFPWPES